MNRKHLIKLTNNTNMVYKELHSMYINRCIVNNISPYTIKSYNYGYNEFNFFTDLEILNCKDIDENLINDYKLFLMDRKLCDTSIHTYVKSIRVIIKYGQSLGYIPTFVISNVRVTEKIKVIYTVQELNLLLKKPTKKSFGVYRNWVIINTLLATGIRSLELISLRIQDIQLENDLLLVSRAKNKRQRYVPISSVLHNVLSEYITIRGGQDESYLFPNSYDEVLPYSTLKCNIVNYHQARGVMKISIHLYRHTFATMYLMNGGDIHTLAKILGHSTLKQVQTYLSLTNDDIKANFNNINPLDKLIIKQRITIKKQSLK